MDFAEHAPPHFHGWHGDREVVVCVDALELLRGALLRRDPALCRAVRVDPAIGTGVWPNGADLDPDVLRWDLPVVAPDAR